MTRADQAKLIRTKIFLKFSKISHTDLARRISESTSEKTTREQVYAVITGRTKTLRIRKALAELLEAPVEVLWPPKTEEVKRVGNSDDANASRKSQSIGNSEPSE